MQETGVLPRYLAIGRFHPSDSGQCRWILLDPLTGLLGQTGVFERLYLPLQIDQSTTLEVTDWRPDSDTGRELNDTLAWYLTNH